MSQQTHIIDIRRPFIPADPNSFAATYHDTGEEDNPEPRIPVVPYDMANCMPTPQGYASYFGINSNLGINTLVASGGTGNVDDLFMIQTNTFVNILVALCDDGIWTKRANTSGNWTHEITLSVPAAGTHKNWSKCVLENTVFVYRQAEATVWVCRDDESYVFTAVTPSTLNMTGQLGIFKAGGRLGFWDSENSTAWSDLGAPIVAAAISFVPSQQSLAGASIFQDIVGRIVNVLQHGTGFIIYATKSIVHVTRNPSNPSLFAGRAIFNNNGISYREEVCYGEPDTIHYAMTTQGFVIIENGQAKFEIPDVFTYLKEKRQPVYVKIMNGRYLFFPFVDPYYTNGIASFQTEEFGPLSITFKGASYAVDNPEENACRAFNAGMRNHEGKYLFDTYGYTAQNQANGNAQVPIWEDHLNTIITLSLLEAWKASGVTGNGSVSYFDDKFTAQGGIAKITSGTEYFIPTGLVTTAAYVFQANMRVEANERNFWDKQDWLWHYEGNFTEDWKEAIQRKSHSSNTTNTNATVASVTVTPYEFGPYIDLTFFSESNKYYGIADKSAWLQRSFVRGITVRVEETQTIVPNTTGLPDSYSNFKWTITANYTSQPQPATLGQVKSAIDGTAAILAILDPGSTFAIGTATIVSATQFTQKYARVSPNPIPDYATVTFTQGATADPSPDYTITIPSVEAAMATKTQTFSRPTFKYVDFATCTYKELGYTQITGHGHYTLAGAFVQDNTTDEAVDYTDICLGDPPDKRKQPQFNGTYIPAASDGFACSPSPATINSVTYSYPDEVVTLPGGTNFLQNGSIEPVYPTYLGAFVYDLHLKKWGKKVQSYKQLLDFFPNKNMAGDGPIPYDTFLPKASMLSADGNIYHYDQYPNDAFITFGKFGQSRKGFTDLEEIHIQHRTPMSGTVTAQGSLDGRVLEVGYENVTQAQDGFGLSARWYNITIEHHFDLTNLEIRSSRKGKR